MTDPLFVKPAPGLIVRDPASPSAAPLPAEGKAVPRDSFWLRRLEQGDVEETSAQAIAAAAKKADAAAKKEGTDK